MDQTTEDPKNSIFNNFQIQIGTQRAQTPTSSLPFTVTSTPGTGALAVGEFIYISFATIGLRLRLTK